MAHVTLDFEIFGHCRLVDESSTTVEIITSQTIYHGLDRIERTLVQDEVPGYNMNYSGLSTLGKWDRERHTIAHGFHLRFEEDAAFEFENLAVIFIHDLESLIDNCWASSVTVLICF